MWVHALAQSHTQLIAMVGMPNFCEAGTQTENTRCTMPLTLYVHLFFLKVRPQEHQNVSGDETVASLCFKFSTVSKYHLDDQT